VHPRHRGVGVSFRLCAVATADRETGSDHTADGLPRHLTRWSAGDAKQSPRFVFGAPGPTVPSLSAPHWAAPPDGPGFGQGPCTERTEGRFRHAAAVP